MVIEISGEPEVVFDWTDDNCEDEHIPDIAARAFRDADGMVQLWIGHYYNYRMVGPDLNSVESDCTQLLRSAFDSEPGMFNDSSWLASPYTFDGNTIYAIVLNEYRGDTHGAVRPDQCPSGERLTCLDTSLVMTISTDGGDSFQPISEPPNHLIGTSPYPFNDQGGPSGIRQPSNIIKRDGFYYVFTSIMDDVKPGAEWGEDWVCLMRTDDLSDPGSWRFWDGEDFTGQFVNPYTTAVDESYSQCAPLELPDLGTGLTETITWNTVLGRYIMIGFANSPTSAVPHWGYYYSLSDDLIHWTERKLLLELPSVSTTNPETDVHYAYPSMLDPDSTSINFETSDGDFYLYITRFNGGYHLDRDLIRYPVHVTPAANPVPTSWHFNTDGNTEGWRALTDLSSFSASNGSLTMTSTGEDPVMHSRELSISASDYNQLWIRMKVSGSGPTSGELFFTTDADTELDGTKYYGFEIIADGQWHDYVLDLSAVDAWQGVITLLRLDPVTTAGMEIEIDLIGFIE